jgi:putative FmdB family regulatory protein
VIYEYICKGCNQHFEVWATVAEKEKGLKAVCPTCGSADSRQAMGSFAIGGRSRNRASFGCGCGPGQC